MPNLKLTNLVAYREYFKAIAQKHKDIDGFKWGNKDVISNDNRSDMPQRFLWAMPYDTVKYSDGLSDNKQKIKQARIIYMIVPDSALFSDEDFAFEFCESVIEDIIGKILLDKAGAMGATEWEMIVTDVKSMTTSPAEKIFGSTKYIGWDLTINFMDNTNLSYDSTKWNN
jgi:hypothetical protein